MLGGRIELTRVCILQSAYVPRKFNACRLHSQTDAKVRHFLFTRVPDSVEHSLDSTLAEPAGHQDPVVCGELLLVASIIGGPRFQPLRLDPSDVQLEVL